MKKVLKMLLTFLVGITGLGCLFLFGEAIYRDLNALNEDVWLVIPVGIFLLSIPSLIFHFRTLTIYDYADLEEVALDSHLLERPPENRSVPAINSFFWIANLLYGLVFLALVVLILASSTNLYASDSSEAPIRWSFLLVMLVLGIGIIIDEWLIFALIRSFNKVR